MAEQAKVPEIRFAGFTDPWEQRKLGELGFAQSGIGFPDAEQGGAEGTPFFKVSDMNTPGNEYELAASKNYVTAEQIARMGWHPLNQVPAIFFAKVGAAVMLNRKRLVNEPFLLDNNTMAFSMDSSLLDTQFGQSLFERLDLTSLIQVGALPSFNSSDVESISVSLPSTMDEQRQIGQYLCNLNTLITLHQRKYDKLVVFKKSMFEKMFPKDGESVPEIRFAGFTDPWEQRKLGELEKDATLYMGRGRVISAKDMSNTPGTFPVYSSSALDNGRMGAYGKYMFNQELITWSIDGGGAVFYRRKHRFSVTNVSGYIAVNPEKINCKFLAYAMSLAHSRIKFDYTVKAHPSVIRSLYTMGIPISLQEQQVIGSFFSRLDNLITLHQRKLELLRNIKKSLLDKMFV